MPSQKTIIMSPGSEIAARMIREAVAKITEETGEVFVIMTHQEYLDQAGSPEERHSRELYLAAERERFSPVFCHLEPPALDMELLMRETLLDRPIKSMFPVMEKFRHLIEEPLEFKIEALRMPELALEPIKQRGNQKVPFYMGLPKFRKNKREGKNQRYRK